jgi:O-antigen/teichoic acid export membrane protein
VFIHQIAGYVFNSTDTIILTYFCGLKSVSVYAMYNMLFGMVNSLIGNVMGGAVFALGQIFQTDRQRFLKVNNCYETLNLALTFAACSVAYICILPFMKLYTKGVTDIDYIDQLLPVLFVAIMVLQAGRDPSMRIINFAGKFKETQPHALAEMIVNLVVSILGVIRFGIYGVLFGTVAALIVRSVLMIHYSYGVILQSNEFRIYRKWLINIVLLLAFERCLLYVSCPLDTYLNIILFAAVAMIAALIVFVGSAMLYDKDARETLVEYYRELKVKKDINR